VYLLLLPSSRWKQSKGWIQNMNSLIKKNLTKSTFQTFTSFLNLSHTNKSSESYDFLDIVKGTLQLLYNNTSIPACTQSLKENLFTTVVCDSLLPLLIVGPAGEKHLVQNQLMVILRWNLKTNKLKKEDYLIYGFHHAEWNKRKWSRYMDVLLHR